ncbi:Mu-like prophage protein [Campylobacter pinnipediorum subsp. caledonicus]|uniref:Mu-like prophage protein n=1 Tax=Campylobacter pinnipediorum subsp. caledonicus TaxID=1874362 RepID=A0A1S6U877_9BACT|nr:phage protease [Campylobacter pinnipediorum]AQW85478.1 Mu-like prophage protein [Campylobacter pinnipediorum subsp. caledonicus]AQW87890.1 Mu-like prophage protein [Campylobacter pinnipediorum subsp. caledonicus]
MRFGTDLIALKQDSGELVEILLAVVGEWKGHPQGTFRVDIADIEKMKINFDSKKIDLVVDYEHQTLMGVEAPAAGWIKSLNIKDNSLYGMVEWTKRAKEYIKNGEYKYLSPVFNFAAVDKKTGAWIGCELESVALTNTPFLDELKEVRANKNFISKENDMPENLAKQNDEIVALKTELEQSLKQNAELKTQNSELKAQLAKDCVESAIFANKISDTQKEWALKYANTDLNGFKEFLKGVKEDKKQVNIPNDVYANKNISEDIDVVKYALGE